MVGDEDVDPGRLRLGDLGHARRAAVDRDDHRRAGRRVAAATRLAREAVALVEPARDVRQASMPEEPQRPDQDREPVSPSASKSPKTMTFSPAARAPLDPGAERLARPAGGAGRGGRRGSREERRRRRPRRQAAGGKQADDALAEPVPGAGGDQLVGCRDGDREAPGEARLDHRVRMTRGASPRLHRGDGVTRPASGRDAAGRGARESRPGPVAGPPSRARRRAAARR